MSNLDVPLWLNDGKQVLYRGRPVRGADPKTFEALLGSFARDATCVFFNAQKLKADRATFRPISAYFGADVSQAFFATTPIKDADPNTFHVLDSSLLYASMGKFIGGGYAADAESVWFASSSGIKRIKKADPVSFLSLGNGYGSDGERVFFQENAIEGADRITWRYWAGRLSIDKNSVYFADKRVEGVDRPSVWLLTARDCFMDRYRIYSDGRCVAPEEYIERLEHVESACKREREQIPSGGMFERIKQEHPSEI